MIFRWFQHILDVPISDPTLRRRGQIIIWLSIGFLALGMINTVFLVLQQGDLASLVPLGVAIVAHTVAIILARMGKVLAAGGLIVGMALMGVLASRYALPQNAISATIFTLIPILLAIAILPTPFILFTGIGALGVLAIGSTQPLILTANGSGELLQALVVITIIATTIGIVNSSSMWKALSEARDARAALEQTNLQLLANNADLEQHIAERTVDLQQALEDAKQRAIIQEQLVSEVARQREEITEISMPVLPIGNNTLVMPLVGQLDARRLHEMQHHTLQALERSRAEYLIIDVTGIALIDTFVASNLMHMIQAAHLLGTRVTLVGVRPEVAQTIVSLGIDFGGMDTAQDLQMAMDNIRTLTSMLSR